MTPRCQLCGSAVDVPYWDDCVRCGCGATTLTKEQIADFDCDRKLFIALITGDPEARSDFFEAYDTWVGFADLSAGIPEPQLEGELL